MNKFEVSGHQIVLRNRNFLGGEAPPVIVKNNSALATWGKAETVADEYSPPNQSHLLLLPPR